MGGRQYWKSGAGTVETFVRLVCEFIRNVYDFAKKVVGGVPEVSKEGAMIGDRRNSKAIARVLSSIFKMRSSCFCCLIRKICDANVYRSRMVAYFWRECP